MNRAEMLRLAGSRNKPWDMVIIGGGATGMGIALDASSRGYEVLLLERSDFGKGTSSRSTKLVHGGVRYLQQGNFPLVFEALRERELLARNAPHLIGNLPFIVPAYEWWEKAYYGAGLKLYDGLAGRSRFGDAEILSRSETLARLPNVRSAGLRGGILYHDGQFDDARLLIAMTRTAAVRGAAVLNYAGVTGFLRDAGGRVRGVTAIDSESGAEMQAEAKVVINATGPFCDEVRRLADPGVRGMVTPSQGIHLVVDGSFLGGKSAIMVPRTTDGRVMFAIPWLGHTLLGTTDTPIPEVSEEPSAQEREVEFVLANAERYFERPPRRRDVLSVFAGIRPLIRSQESAATAALARDHQIRVDESGLLTITGGKWTTYRRMSELCVDRAASAAHLSARPCVTRGLKLQGADDAGEIERIAKEDERLSKPLLAGFPHTGADVVWAVRAEMARTVEDILARRLRVLFLNSRAALDMAPSVAGLMAAELGRGHEWIADQVSRFSSLASGYSLDFAADASESSLTL